MRYDDRFRARCDSTLKTRRYVGELLHHLPTCIAPIKERNEVWYDATSVLRRSVRSLRVSRLAVRQDRVLHEHVCRSHQRSLRAIVKRH
jgi:hypothetical protein